MAGNEGELLYKGLIPNDTIDTIQEDLIFIETKTCTSASCPFCLKTGFCPVNVYKETNALGMYRNEESSVFVIIARDTSVLLRIYRLSPGQLAEYNWAIQLVNIQTNTMNNLFSVLSKQPLIGDATANCAHDVLLVSKYSSFAVSLKGVTRLQDLVKLYTDNIKQLTYDYIDCIIGQYKSYKGNKKGLVLLNILKRVCNDKKIDFRDECGSLSMSSSSKKVTIKLRDHFSNGIIVEVSTTKYKEDIVLIDAIDTMLIVYNSWNNLLRQDREKWFVYIKVNNTNEAKLALANAQDASLVYVGNDIYVKTQKNLNIVYKVIRPYIQERPEIDGEDEEEKVYKRKGVKEGWKRPEIIWKDEDNNEKVYKRSSKE